MNISRRARATAAFLLASCAASAAQAQLASFAGAVGFGAVATGGRGQTIYHVTNLNDTGAGSFRDAVSGSNRTIVFDVGGYVHIASPITAQSNLTILGQTAPGQGFGVYGAEVSFYGRSNDIVRYVRFLDTDLDPGGTGTGNSSGNCINLGNTTNMIFDHVSCEFASYNNIDAGGTTGADELTFQNSIVANPISSQQFNFHWEGSEGTFINNVFVDAHNRSILSKGNVQYVNNTVYNYQAGFTTGNSSGKFSFDVLNNYFITGPSTTSSSNNFYQVDSNQKAYATGNILDGNADGKLNGSADNSVDGAVVLNAPWSSATANLPLLSASAAYTYNMTHSGDSLQHDATSFATSLGYDDVDGQVISNVQTLGTAGRMWSHQSQTGLSNGGLGTITGGSRPTDTDNDGIPDAWESAHGLNPAVADSNKLNPVGYTMVEQYANELADSTDSTRVWTSSGGEWNTAGKWSSTTPITYDIASVQGLGAGTDGVVTVSTATPAAYQLYIGGNGDLAGEKVQVTSGKLDVLDTIYVGNTNTGTLQVDGGIVQASNVVIGNTAGGTTYTGAVILNGGTLQTSNVVLGGGTPGAWTSGGSITFNGGTLQALGTLNVNAPATISSSVATIDTNGFAGTMSGVISGAGALTKIGAGVLTLSANNTFAGGVNLNGGELGIATDANIGGPSSTINFQGGLLQITGTAITNLDSHTVNWSTFNGGFDIAAANNTFTVTQSIGGSGSVTIGGLGIVVLGSGNTYTGGTILAGGILSVSDDAQLGPVGNPVTFAGGTLRVTGTTFTNLNNHAPTFSTSVSTIDVNTAANTFTISQVIGGGGGITKAGPGVLVLSGLNSFTGDTNITGGTLRLGNALALRKSTVNLTTAGVTLDLNGFNATFGGLAGNRGLDLKGSTLFVGLNTETYSGVISSSIGAGSVVKNNGGAWTVSGASTYTGSTTLSGGILNVATLPNGGTAGPIGASTNAAANLVFDGGTLQYTGAAGLSTDRLFTLTPNGGTLDGSGASGNGLGFSNTGAIAFTGTGNRTLNLIGTEMHNSFFPALGDADGSSKTSVVMNGTGRWLWQSKLSTYSGNTTILAGTIRLYQGGFLPSGAGKGNVIVDAGGTLVADASTNINALIDGTSGPGGVTVSGGTLTMGNGDVSGTFTGVIGGAGGIGKTGTGTQTLAGANTYTGGTIINGGVLAISATGSIPNTSNVSFANVAGATLTLAASDSIGSLAGGGSTGGNVSLANGITLTSGGANATTAFAGIISGSAAFTQTGTGVQTLSGANTYTGITTIGSGATLAIPTIANGGLASPIGASSSAAGSLLITGKLQYTGLSATTNRGFTPGGTIEVTSAGTILEFDGALTAGTLTKTGLGILKLGGTHSGANGYVVSGGTLLLAKSSGNDLLNAFSTINSTGTLQLGGSSQIAAASIIALNTGGVLDLNGFPATFDYLTGGGTVTNSSSTAATLGLGANNGSALFSGIIQNGAGALALSKSGSGTILLSGANNYSGATTITAGTLEIASPGSLASTSLSTALSSSLTVDPSASLASTTNLSDTGTANFKNTTQTIATLNGTGTVNLNPTVLTITNGGTFSGNLAGTGGLAITGGLLKLSGQGNYTGATTVNGGSLEIASPGTLAGSSVTTTPGSNLTIDSGAALASSSNLNSSGVTNFLNLNQTLATLNGSGTVNINPTALTISNGGNFSGAIAGTGNLTATGGTLILSGAGTYPGITTVRTGAILAPVVANGGLPSGMGASSSAASNLVLDGGTLKGAGITDRALTLTNLGGTLDNSSGFSLSGPGAIAVPAGTNVTLTLTGSSGAHNTMNLSLADAGGGFVTSVLKTGTGKWTFSADGTKTYSGDTHIALGQLEALTGDAFSHNSNMVIDAGASLELHNNNITVNGLQGGGSIFNSFNSGTRTLTIGANNGGGTWNGVINSGPTLNVVKTGSGSETFTNANTYTGATTISQGTLTLADTGSLTSTSLYVSSNATFNLNGAVPATASLTTTGITNIGANTGSGLDVLALGPITINNNGVVNVLTTTDHNNHTLLVTSGLTLAGSAPGWNASLDLTGNDLVVQDGVLSDIVSQLTQGFNAGAGYWDGANGIISTTAAGDPQFLTTLGYGSGGNPLDGVNTGSDDVLVKYTYFGDADLSGTIDGADYQQIDMGFGTNATGWSNGDFNYDGVINGSDFALIDNAFNQITATGAGSLALIASPTAEFDSLSSASVPEPTALGFAAIGIVGWLTRLRRAPRR